MAHVDTEVIQQKFNELAAQIPSMVQYRDQLGAKIDEMKKQYPKMVEEYEQLTMDILRLDGQALALQSLLQTPEPVQE